VSGPHGLSAGAQLNGLQSVLGLQAAFGGQSAGGQPLADNSTGVTKVISGS